MKYKDKIICILEKDDAVEEFRTNDQIVNISDSIVANKHSSIEGVKK